MAEDESEMAKGSGPRRRRPAWVRPAASLAFIVSSAAVAVVVLNTPAPKAVEIDLACEAFHAPADFVIPVSAERFQRVHLRGYVGRMERVTRLSVEGVSTGEAFRSTDLPALTFGADPDRPVSSLPSLSLHPMPEGHPGPISLRIGAGVVLRGAAGATTQNVPLELQSRRAGDTSVTLEMDAVDAEANRLSIPELRQVEGFAEEDEFNIHAWGRPGMVRCFFQAMAPPAGSKVLATFDFTRGAAALALVQPDEGENGPMLYDRVIHLSGKIDGKLTLGNEEPRAVKGTDLDVWITARRFELRALTLEPPAQPAQPSLVRVRGRGEATSVKRGGQELIPTALEEILNKPPAQRGLFGLFAAFFVFAATVFGNRALTVLAILLLPDPKPDQGDHP